MKDINLGIVQIKTTLWSDEKGMYQKKKIIFLDGQSNGIKDDLNIKGVDFVIPCISNLDNSADGIYKILVHNNSNNYLLIPHTLEGEK